MRPTSNSVSLFLSLSLFLPLFRWHSVSLILLSVPGYAHMCAGHEVALLAVRFWRGPLPRGGEKIGSRCCRCAASRSGGDAGAGMRVVGRGVAISTVPSSPENERTNELFPPLSVSHRRFLSVSHSFLFVSRADICLSLSLPFYYISSFHLTLLFFYLYAREETTSISDRVVVAKMVQRQTREAPR